MPYDPSFVLVAKPRPHITVVTLNRPDRMNAMAFDVMVPLREQLERIANDNDTRVVILTGAGDAFCAGADTKNAGPPPHIDGLTVTTIAQRAGALLDSVILAIYDMPHPVIAAINGPAIGGGMCLAAACDIRIASTAAYFRAAGINNGLTAAELGMSFLLPRIIGSGRASEIMLTGRDVDAAEAAAIGLVSSVEQPDALFEQCFATAERIVGLSRIGVELTKKMIWAGLESGSIHAHMRHEMTAQLYVRMTTKNWDEAMLARAEGRPPNFRD